MRAKLTSDKAAALLHHNCALISPSADGLLRSMQADIERVLFDEPAIHKRLDQMAAQITADYRDHELTVIAVLTGSIMFMSDLLRRIPLPLEIGLPERGELSRKNANERERDIQRYGCSRCRQPRCLGPG